MVYLNKNDGKIKNCQAKEYTKGKGRFYRGCEYESGDVEFYQIDDLIIPFDLFCEFMGYWLSDGSTMSNSGVVISQQEGETQLFEDFWTVYKQICPVCYKECFKEADKDFS